MLITLTLNLLFSYTGIENVTIGGGYFFDNQEDKADEETDMLIFMHLLLLVNCSWLQSTLNLASQEATMSRR